MKKKVLLFLTLAIIFSFGLFSINQMEKIYASDEVDKFNQKAAYDKAIIYAESFDEKLNYYTIYNGWLNEGLQEGSDQIIIDYNDIVGGTGVSDLENDQEYHDLVDILNQINDEYGSETIFVKPLDEITFDVNVVEEGLYEIYLDYYILEFTKLTPSLEIEINELTQYNEMNNIEIPVKWRLEQEAKFDRYGDELTPKSEIHLGWMYEAGLVDPNHFFIEPLKFNLLEGTNQIRITFNEGYLVLGDIKIVNKNHEIPTYTEYKSNQSELNLSQGELVTIEAEDLTFKSRQSIRAKYMRDPQVTPYEYKNRVLNVLDGHSFSEPGDKVTYRFKVEKSGYYNLAVKYYLNTNNGLPSHRGIYIDGEIPFKELVHYQFKYQTRWKNEILKDGQGVPFEIYLEEGEHTLSLVADNAKVRDIYHSLVYILDDMESISTDINKITGGLVDKERNWKIVTYIPDLVERLQAIVNQLDQTIINLREYSQNDNLPILSELEIARKLIKQFVKDPEELPGYLEKFDEGESSAYGRINRSIPMLIVNPIHLDKIHFFNDVDLPKANSNLFVKFFEGIKAFFYSFFDPKYNEVSKVDDDTIEIWVNKSRLYVEIMQKMIDQDFTPNTGIKVQLSLMPDENKIILSNAAGSTPDGIIGVSSGRPFELAIRGVIEDLRDYPEFYSLASEFNPSTFVPYIYADGVYAIPETQDVKLLFYRKDILEQLDVDAPQTWDEVISLIPVLQKYDMNFFAPIGHDNSFKAFDVTTPFIYQYGGNLYDQSTMNSIINKDGAFHAFEVMTDLFSVYNLPVTTSNFYQHFRNGNIPVGIADANMYIQLKYAAPELAGQWGILPIPGVENEDGIIERWDPTYGSSSIIFKDSKKKEASWELIKWWSGAQTQTKFSYEIQATLGNKFLYMSANLQGFRDGAWPSDSKNVVLQQWDWIQATGKVPGDYMLERELSNAWNRVIFDGINPRVAIDESVPIINRELHRKLVEFGYLDRDGNILKEYKIPTIQNVESWVRKDEND